MTTERTLNPPEDKFKRWEDDILNERENVDVVLDCAWKDGYRAGADQELKACCEYMQHEDFHGFAKELREARRPKPPSLAEQALTKIDAILGDPQKSTLKDELEALELSRAALERLQELEKGNE